MNILITGISGFVARHFVELLSTFDKPVKVSGIYNNNKPEFKEDHFRNLRCNFYKMDLQDTDSVRDLLRIFQPDYVIHLASKSSVVYSWQFPAEAIRQNTGMFMSLIENIRLLKLKCRLLSIGSAEEYGYVDEDKLPLVETMCALPSSPYGVARVMQQSLADIYTKNYGLDIIHTRSFNHIGPYQSPHFVLSSFAKQIIEQKKNGNKNIEITVGNIEVTRDFTDVRDVVKAYYLLLEKGETGSIYNICSNKGIILKELVTIFAELTGTDITCNIDPATFHPSENKQVIGSYEKINKQTGWSPVIPIKKTLGDLLEYWDQRINHEQL